MTLAKSDQTFFLGIGVEHAGANWMRRQLAFHSDVWTPTQSEIHYFDAVHLELEPTYRADCYQSFRDQLEEYEWAELVAKPARLERLDWLAKLALVGDPDDQWYTTLFEEAGRRFRVFGEVTPAYAALPRAGFEHIRALEPNARIILLLRDPVARLWSAFLASSKTGLDEPATASTEEIVAFAGQSRMVAATRYDVILDHLNSVFAPEQVLTAFSEDVFVDAPAQAEFLATLGQFIGVSPEGFTQGRTLGTEFMTPPGNPPEKLLELLPPEYTEIVNRVEDHIGRVPESWKDHA